MARRNLVQSLVLLLALGFTLVAPVLANGGKAKSVIYEGWARPQTGSGDWQFTINTSPLIFYLGTVKNKYHVLLIRVRNNTDEALKLSKDQDTIELRFFDGQKVKGLLNLPTADRATWDGLETELRTAVVYPEVVKAGEEEGIFLYVPVGDVAAPRKNQLMPRSVIYSIKSLPSPLELRERGPAAA